MTMSAKLGPDSAGTAGRKDGFLAEVGAGTLRSTGPNFGRLLRHRVRLAQPLFRTPGVRGGIIAVAGFVASLCELDRQLWALRSY